ncbi:hypothetical protein SANTM175S_00655 [Streptomyces antimycoticus]
MSLSNTVTEAPPETAGSPREQGPYELGTDEAGAPGDEYPHERSVSMRFQTRTASS